MVAPQGKGPAVVARRCSGVARSALQDEGCWLHDCTPKKSEIKFGSQLQMDIMFLMSRSHECVLLAVLVCLLRGLSLHAAPDYTEYARLLETYVVEDGVRYAEWYQQVADLARLEAFVTELGQTDVDALSKDDQKALYLNLYNAAMLRAVFEHYPLESVKDIGLLPFSIFKKKFIALGDARVSLDRLEKGILLKMYFDPRIHFAVNCASESCPPLRAEPYRGDRLEAQLEEQTRLFADSHRAARVNQVAHSVAYSELFKWYADDFSVQNPARFLNRFRQSKLPIHYAIDWLDYDWSLNAASN